MASMYCTKDTCIFLTSVSAHKRWKASTQSPHASDSLSSLPMIETTLHNHKRSKQELRKQSRKTESNILNGFQELKTLKVIKETKI